MDNIKIGMKIKELRKANKMTQQELANKIGRTESSIRKYEKGLVDIPNAILNQIATALGTTTSTLLGMTVFHEKQAKVLDDLLSSNSIEYGQTRAGYQHLLVSLERLFGKFPNDEETILSILTRFMFMIEGLYLNVGNNSKELVSKDLAIVDELTSKLTTLLSRDTVFNPLGDLNKYNALSQQDILDINSLLNDARKNRLERYIDTKDSDY